MNDIIKMKRISEQHMQSRSIWVACADIHTSCLPIKICIIFVQIILTEWRIYASVYQAIISSNSGLLPVQMHLKMSSAEWCPSCLGIMFRFIWITRLLWTGLFITGSNSHDSNAMDIHFSSMAFKLSKIRIEFSVPRGGYTYSNVPAISLPGIIKSNYQAKSTGCTIYDA